MLTQMMMNFIFGALKYNTDFNLNYVCVVSFMSLNTFSSDQRYSQLITRKWLVCYLLLILIDIAI